MDRESQEMMIHGGFIGGILHAILFCVAPHGPLEIYGDYIVPATTWTETFGFLYIVLSSLFALLCVGGLLFGLIDVLFKQYLYNVQHVDNDILNGSVVILLCNIALFKISAGMYSTTPSMPNVDYVAAGMLATFAICAAWVAVMIPRYQGRQVATA
ncbi:MAG: hypothetical protein ACNFW9_05075 [Candidatus Kerfeldbacteria bacterium]|jgi:hypothetical protein